MTRDRFLQTFDKRFVWGRLFLLLVWFMGPNMACDSGGGNGQDNSPPVVFINQPTDAPIYATRKDAIIIGGTASDNQGIEQVIWESSTGDTGRATGTVSWEATIDLSPGSNQIMVTAMDAAGNTGSDTLNVTLTGATYSLSGTVTAASNTAIDSDVNDPNAPYTPNDNASQAQMLPTPLTLGGYVNEPLTGEAGRSFSSGDSKDVFQADLLAGEKIILNIAAPSSDADLDMYLYDATDLTLIDSALARVARTEMLTAPEAGSYLIQVVTDRGASNYTLTIGQTQNNQGRAGLRLSCPFVPGEAIISFAAAASTQAHTLASPAGFGLIQKAGAAGRAGLFEFPVDNTGKGVVPLQSMGISPPPLLGGASMSPHMREKLATLLQIKALRGRAEVAMAEPNYIHRIFQTPDDPYYPLQWHYPLISLPNAWEIPTDTPNITVAVIDTGVILDHPDLKGRIIEDSYDFIRDPNQALDGDGIDDNADDPGDDSQGGSSFHGTHVAGTIAAATGNGIGVSGIAWNSQIMAIRALGQGATGASYDIIQAVRYAAGLDNDSGTTPESPADIINLSIGGSGFSQAEQNVYTQARTAGVITVAAAGNSAANTPSYPAAYEGVISVSAVDINARPAPYSNFGATIDVAAPGGDFATDLNGDGYVDGVLSTGGDDSAVKIQNVYTFFQGTSMAAPHMAGVIALMKSVRSRLTPADLDGYLQSGAIVRDLGAAGWDEFYGYGLIDAEKAVLAARDGSVPTVLNVSPVALSLGISINTAKLTASKVGDAPLSLADVSINADWLTVSVSETDENGLGTYTVSVNRGGLSDGAYTAEITFASTENTVTVPVTMRISSSNMPPDAGFHYVLLVAADTDETVNQISISGENGLYKYAFTGVDPGIYKLYAGTDSDNDFNIGDAGEAIGAYLSTDQPISIKVGNNRSDLDFITEFSVNIPESENAAGLGRNGSASLKKVEK